MTRVYLHALGILNALGNDAASVRRGLYKGSTAGMQVRDDFIPGRPVHVGAVHADLPPIEPQWPEYNSRNNRILAAAIGQIRPQLDAAIDKYGAARVGIVLGTGTSGITEGEQAYAHHLRHGAFPAAYDYRQQEISGPSEYLRHALSVRGPTWTVSTACTSSAKALASARRLLHAGICDAVVSGGVDSLCRLTLNGFAALESVARGLCNPFSRNRDGINVGEGAAVFLLSREPGPVCVLGVGESSDAWHISAPDPQGRGAELAMRAALSEAGVNAAAVDYLNLHGTATVQNDLVESHAVARVFGSDTPCSSTKPLVGHMLGAAGATELAFCWLLLTESAAAPLPPHVWDGAADPALAPLRLCRAADASQHCRIAASNSFAFGGSNICVLLGRA
ncbi:MAG TPA: beta-ketoacyl-[acyl-carrier-protein] synthase family protein [Gammaproteobacteria bacterium]|nr:beta-ketoacyl-[acyl-carrier-protein] synthase family protein [Gammaproteobacteria bacterium]